MGMRFSLAFHFFIFLSQLYILLIFFYSVRFLYCSFSVSLHMLERLSGERDEGIEEEEQGRGEELHRSQIISSQLEPRYT